MTGKVIYDDHPEQIDGDEGHRAHTAPAGPLDESIEHATQFLLTAQQPDGHWVYAFEGDTTVSADYVLLVRYLGETLDGALEQKIARYLRRRQQADGGWSLFPGGAPDASASVKAYLALKLIGDDVNAEHMQRARRAIHAMGGAETCNVYTRILLALYGIVPWRAVPMMPVEMMLQPSWMPLHLSKISCWARAVIVPLLVLNAVRPVAKHLEGLRIDELFRKSPARMRLVPRQPHQSAGWFAFFRIIDHALRHTDRFFPHRLRRDAIDKAVAFVTERLNGDDGFGGIYPSMAFAVMMYDALGYPKHHPDHSAARQAIEKLLVVGHAEAYCQAAVSPVWDTSWAALALWETNSAPARQAVMCAAQWLKSRQILDVRGDWVSQRPHVRSGGWSFQYRNDHYPDIDDTAVAAAAVYKAAKLTQSALDEDAAERAREWVVAMQCRCGGWGAFDTDNIHSYWDNIPFSDHGAMIDPPTADVSARCLYMLGQLGERVGISKCIDRAVRYLWREQEADGSWFGRWGINYIYGTWSVLMALDAVGVDHDEPRIQHAVQWLVSIQNADGGWGESAESYAFEHRGHEPAPSATSQTAWALLGLMVAGEAHHPTVTHGVDYLLRTQQADGHWDEDRFNGTAFPRGMYIHYHGYRAFFPLWALARYRRLMREGQSEDAPMPATHVSSS